MKKIFVLILITLFTTSVFGAGSDDSSSNEENLYKDAKNLINRGKKLEKKNKQERALKLYASANEKLFEAYKKDKKNADVLNYLGFTLRKAERYKEAEKYYLLGLDIKPNHNGINEYLGELYVKTNRIDKAKERLNVLKNCNCEEYGMLELVIKTRGNITY